MTPKNLLQLWKSLSEGRGTDGLDRRRLETEASVDIFACIFWPSRRLGLLIQGDGEVRPAFESTPEYRGVRVLHEVVDDELPHTVLMVVLEDSSLLDTFAVLSADLIGAVKEETTAPIALHRCVERLSLWGGLFERIPSEGLSAERQRGLFGELVVLENFLLTRLDSMEAIVSWAGPDSAHQDFSAKGSAIEVKTTLAKRHTRLRISSEKQLDERPHQALLIAHVRLDESDAHGVTLPRLVSRLRTTLSQDVLSLREFERRLFLSGYLNLHSQLYETTRYVPTDQRYFHVSGDFPRLTEENLPPGVGDIRYTIVPGDLTRYELTEQEAAKALGWTND